MLDPSGFNKEQAKIGRFLDFDAIPTFALSFPFSKRAPSINYIVRNDYWNNDDEDSEENR